MIPVSPAPTPTPARDYLLHEQNQDPGKPSWDPWTHLKRERAHTLALSAVVITLHVNLPLDMERMLMSCIREFQDTFTLSLW